MATNVTKTMCREAADDLTELQRLRGEIETLAAGLAAAAFEKGPSEGGWSVGECIGHLNATARTYLDKMPAAIAAARAQGLTGEGPVKRGWFGRMFLWALEPPAKIKVKAPQAFLPSPGLGKDETMREFREIRGRLGELMEASGDLDWSRVTMPLPTIPRFKLRLGEVFAVLLAHERRHLWQMQRTVRSA
jgi:hypothetical protein